MRALEVAASSKTQATNKGNRLTIPVFYGLFAGAGLLIFFLGLITLAQDWPHALQQLGEDKWFITPILAGFAIQVGLFVYLRQIHAKAHSLGVAASTGTSTAAMLACCAHHLADILPILGLSGAALFLNEFKTPFLVAGIAMNLAAIAYLVFRIWQVKQAAACMYGTRQTVNK
jgi:hypothetical protein